MASKKKVTKKRAKPKVKRKKPAVKKKVIRNKAKPVARRGPVKKKVRKTTTSLIYSFVVFVLSLILFLVSANDTFEEAIFGFILVLSGALVILFLVVELILYFYKKK